MKTFYSNKGHIPLDYDELFDIIFVVNNKKLHYKVFFSQGYCFNTEGENDQIFKELKIKDKDTFCRRFYPTTIGV